MEHMGGTQSTLVKVTFGELLDAGRTPSGLPFVLKPDTVENGLKVAEAKDQLKWREKAMQVMAVTESIGGQDIKKNGGVDFVCGLLDTDVVFLAMAWTSEVNGRALKLGQSIPCPQCTAPMTEIDLSGLAILARREPASGPSAIKAIELPPEVMAKLPDSVKSGTIMVKDPTWRESRMRVPAACGDDVAVIDVHRALSALMVSHDGRAPRAVVAAEASKFPMRAIQIIITKIDEVIPNFTRDLVIHCSTCGAELDVPFDRAGV